MSSSPKTFREMHTFEKRKEESSKILSKYEDRVPVIVERASKSESVPEIDKKKFLVPSELTLAQFLVVIRKRMSLTSETALFVFAGQGKSAVSIMPANSDSLASIYQKYKDDDGFLYITYAGEKTFG